MPHRLNFTMRFLKQTFTLLILLPLTVFAQKNYKVAVLTNLINQKDTVLIEGQNWSINPKSFQYLSTDYVKKGVATLANTSNIMISSQRVFERAIIKKSMDKIKYPDLPKLLDSTSKVDTAFLELIMKGQNINLYSYTDQLKTRYYVKPLGEKYQELTFRSFYSAAINFKVETQHVFRDELKVFAIRFRVDDPKTLQKIESARYILKDLKEVVLLLNSNLTEFQNTTIKKLNFNIGLGLNFSKFKYNGEKVLGTSSGSKPISLLPVLGLIYTLDEKNRSALNIELAISKEKVKFYGIDNHSEETKSFIQWTYALSPSYSYNLFNGLATKISIAGGISANVHRYKDDVVTYLSTEIPGAKIVTYTNLGGFQDFSFSLVASVGIKLKRVSLITTYAHYLNSMTNFAESEIVKSSYNFSLRYNFGFKRK